MESRERKSTGCGSQGCSRDRALILTFQPLCFPHTHSNHHLHTRAPINWRWFERRGLYFFGSQAWHGAMHAAAAQLMLADWVVLAQTEGKKTFCYGGATFPSLANGKGAEGDMYTQPHPTSGLWGPTYLLFMNRSECFTSAFGSTFRLSCLCNPLWPGVPSPL